MAEHQVEIERLKPEVKTLRHQEWVLVTLALVFASGQFFFPALIIAWVAAIVAWLAWIARRTLAQAGLDFHQWAYDNYDMGLKIASAIDAERKARKS